MSEQTLLLKEYGPFIGIEDAANRLNLKKAEFWEAFQSSIARISKQLGIQNIVEFRGLNSFRFVGVAGIITLNQKYKIEIVPKFLNDSEHWREDFLRIAVMTGQGELFRHNLLRSSNGLERSLFDIIAHSWVEIFELNQRFLIKKYISSRWQDFALDGDYDEEELAFPSSHGFQQTGILYSRSNEFNKLLLDAAMRLSSKIVVPSLIDRLDRAIGILNFALKDPQRLKNGNRTLSYDKRWGALLELSRIIVSSSGKLGYGDHVPNVLPGYLLKTHYAWERLIRLAAKSAFSEMKVEKIGYKLGDRVDRHQNARSIFCTPDISLIHGESSHKPLIDAKYKIAFGADKASVISSADLYESLAFLQSSGRKNMVLIYPSNESISTGILSSPILEVIKVEEFEISAVAMGVNGISSSNGPNMFMRNFKDLISLTAGSLS